MTKAPAASMAESAARFRCVALLSSRTMSSPCSSGTRKLCTNAPKASPSMQPSTSIAATSPSGARAPMIECARGVFLGMLPRRRSPLGAQPWRRTRSVLMLLSSRKMSRGPSERSASISSQCAARSAGSCSLAESTFFFSGEAELLQSPAHGGHAHGCPIDSSHSVAELLQGGIRVTSHFPAQRLQSLLIELRFLPASVRQRDDASALALLTEELLDPVVAHTKDFRHALPGHFPCLHRCNHPLPQIQRIGLHPKCSTHSRSTQQQIALSRMKPHHFLRGARIYLSGPMDFVASRADEKKLGWRNRVGDFLRSFGSIIFGPWFKPAVRGLHQYGLEDVNTIDVRETWTFEQGQQGDETRAACAEKFWETLHIDLRMVDTSDFTIAYVPTNIYSVGTVHEIVLSRLQYKPVLFVSPPVTFPTLDKLREHLREDSEGLALLDKLAGEVPIKPNPRAI